MDIMEIKAGRLAVGQQKLISIFESINGVDVTLINEGTSVYFISKGSVVMYYMKKTALFHTLNSFYCFKEEDVEYVFNAYDLDYTVHCTYNWPITIANIEYISTGKVIDVFRNMMNYHNGY